MRYMTDKVTTEEFKELVKRVDKLENEKMVDDLFKLQVSKIRPSYDHYYCTPSLIPKLITPHNNIYHRTSQQFKEHLKMNGFCVNSVSRVHIGEKKYYYVEFNMTEDDFHNKKNGDYQIRKLLDIKGAGLVDFFKHDNKIHEVVLVDEKELNDKYLKNGNLHF